MPDSGPRVAGSGASGSLLASTPWMVLAALGTLTLVTTGLVLLDVLPRGVLGAVGVTAGLGALLATALAWSAPAPRPGRSRALVAVMVVAVGASGAALAPAGTLAYLATPCWLIVLARRGDLAGLGVGSGTSAVALGIGLGLGATLSAHMLLCAGLTFGYRPLETGLAPVMRAFVYDAGIQVIATEMFFRGALFNRMQRRGSFSSACALSTALSIVRYLVDPLLPPVAELRAGAAFYTGLLAIGNCWLFWRFGTLMPALGASALFFLAYRTLTAR